MLLPHIFAGHPVISLITPISVAQSWRVSSLGLFLINAVTLAAFSVVFILATPAIIPAFLPGRKLADAELVARAYEISVGHSRDVVAHLAMQWLASRFFPIVRRHPIRMLQQKLE